MHELVDFTEEQSYCLIRLDDGKANAISPALLSELNEVLDKAEAAAKVVIIAGRPGKFSAGFDLSIMGQGGEPANSLLRGGAGLSLRLLQFPTPVILAASGHALAMGALLLLSADYRIGIEGDFKIGLNEVAIGMTLPYFGVELAQSRLAVTHLNRAANQAEVFSPCAAIEAGFLDEIVPPENLLERAVALAQQLAKLDMTAHKGTKERVRADLCSALEEVIEREFGA